MSGCVLSGIPGGALEDWKRRRTKLRSTAWIELDLNNQGRLVFSSSMIEDNGMQACKHPFLANFAGLTGPTSSILLILTRPGSHCTFILSNSIGVPSSHSDIIRGETSSDSA